MSLLARRRSTGGRVAIPLADTFDRANGALGSTSTGSEPWEVLSGAWTITTNRAVSSTAAGSNPVAVVESNTADVDISLNIDSGSSGGGDSIVFRAVNSNDYLRLRYYHEYYQTSSQYYDSYCSWTPENCYQVYNSCCTTTSASCSYGSTVTGGSGRHCSNCCGTTRPANTTYRYDCSNCTGGPIQAHWIQYSGPDANCSIWWAEYFRDSNCTGGGQCQGCYQQQCDPGYWSGCYRTNYYDNWYNRLYLERVTNGSTLTNIVSYADIGGAQSGAATSIRVKAVGSSIQAFINGSSTATISTTYATNSTATKHGIGRGASSYTGSAIDNFSLTPVG